jgi:hypothetical protein
VLPSGQKSSPSLSMHSSSFFFVVVLLISALFPFYPDIFFLKIIADHLIFVLYTSSDLQMFAICDQEIN